MGNYIMDRYAENEVALFDLNNDGLYEAIVYDDSARIMLLHTDDKNIAEVRFDLSLIAFNQFENTLNTSVIDDGIVKDWTYELDDGGLRVKSRSVGQIEYDDYTGEPVYSFSIDDASVDSDEYIRWVDTNYTGCVNVDAFTKVSAKEACDMLLNNPEKIDGIAHSYSNNEQVNDSYKYECTYDVQVFMAPLDGTYEFTIRGAAGGADGQRVLDGKTFFDASGAELTGSMDLKMGERVVLLVGGAGGVSNKQAGVVPGGYNGGGDTYWSGGGGGCTDIYTMEGIRVASAAGAGGGNYGCAGEPGRIAEPNPSFCTGYKFGGSTGYQMRDDAGAGGGAGWEGGEAGRLDEAGHGGVNGYKALYFQYISEEPGDTSVDDDEINGFAIVNRTR
jgi:hypothetical protein